MKQTFKVMLARFPGGNSEHPLEVNWLINTVLSIVDEPRISGIDHWWLNDTPVTMSRNRCVQDAIRQGVDILLMVDSDMGPDIIEPTKAFWPTALDFIQRRWYDAPTIVAAPYCGPPPHENIYIFRWRNFQSDDPNPNYKLDQFSREEVANKTGIEAVAALPTGLIAIDMRVFTGFKVCDQVLKLPPPWFYYEWTNEYQTHKASTEDVTFTRDAHLLFQAHGLETVFCNWDAWSLHFKQKAVGKPQVTNPGNLARLFRERSTGQLEAIDPALNNGKLVSAVNGNQGVTVEAEVELANSAVSLI